MGRECRDELLDELGICPCCGEVKTLSAVDRRKLRLRAKLEQLEAEKKAEAENKKRAAASKKKNAQKKERKIRMKKLDHTIKNFENTLQNHWDTAPAVKISLSQSALDRLLAYINRTSGGDTSARTCSEQKENNVQTDAAVDNTCC